MTTLIIGRNMSSNTAEHPHSEYPEPHLASLTKLVESAPDGVLIELGVYRGGSAWAIQQGAQGRPLHLFDTFKGMPEVTEGDMYRLGEFGETDLGAVKAALPEAHFHVGIFPETFPKDLTDIAFVHIDCDHYRTCKFALEIFWPRMVPNGIIAIDDTQFPGMSRAISEFFGEEYKKDNMLTNEMFIRYFVKP